MQCRIIHIKTNKNINCVGSCVLDRWIAMSRSGFDTLVKLLKIH